MGKENTERDLRWKTNLKNIASVASFTINDDIHSITTKHKQTRRN